MVMNTILRRIAIAVQIKVESNLIQDSDAVVEKFVEELSEFGDAFSKRIEAEYRCKVSLSADLAKPIVGGD